MYGARNRPWSPPVLDNLGTPGRGIDRYLAHSSHGWATPPREPNPGPGWDEEHEQTFRRHRANLRAAHEPEYDDAAYFYSSNRRNRRDRDASEISVEALDLADYAQTLRRAEAARDDTYPYPPINNTRPFSREPWSPTASPPARSPNPPQRVWSPPSLPFPPTASVPVERPFSALSRDTMMAPPSLVSAETTSQSSHTHASLNHPMRRPFSLPTDYMTPRGPAIFNAATPPPSARAVGTGRRVPQDAMEMDYGIPNPDVSSFPPWARKWYAQEEATGKYGTKGKRPELPRSPVEDEIFGPYIHPAASQQDLGLLPWSAGQHEEQPLHGTIPDNVKEERIRMLEREFGDKGTRRGGKPAEGGEQIIGGVDEKGNLVTGGRKKRITMRVVQGIFAVLTAASGIYGALFIKLKSPAPPSGRAAAFVLYGLSILTILLLFFFFVVTPLCLQRNKGSDTDMANPAGMMVLPVNTPNQTGKKKNKKWKPGKGGQDPGGSVQVNLIVDPNMFGTGTGRGRGMPGRYDEDEYDDEDDDDATNPSSRRKGRRRRWDEDEERSPPRRRSIFTGLAMERAWKRARSELKKRVALDVVLTIAWTASFVLILLGSRCPPGTLEGWCDAYNIATAGASLLIVLFATSAFFGIKDLNGSKQSPRTRT